MAEDFEHLLDFLVAAVHGRDSVLASQQVQVRGEALQRLRQFEALAQELFALLVVVHLRRDTRDEHLRRHAVAADDRHRYAMALLQDRSEEIRRCDRAARAARPKERALQRDLRGRREATLALRECRQELKVLLQRVEDPMRVPLEVLHHMGERIPFNLRQGEEEVLVGHDRVFAAPALLHGTVHDALS